MPRKKMLKILEKRNGFAIKESIVWLPFISIGIILGGVWVFGVEEVTLISNPDHISRCFQLAHAFTQKNKLPFNFLAAQSDVGYNGTTSTTSRIIEQPHRADDLSPNLAGVIGDYFTLTLDKKNEFVELVADYLEKGWFKENISFRIYLFTQSIHQLDFFTQSTPNNCR